MRIGRYQSIGAILLFLVAAAAGLASPRPANAGLIVVNSRSAFDTLGTFVPVDWGVFGPTGTVISTPASQIVGPLTVGVASSQGVLARNDEGNTYFGDFAIGDRLLTDGGSKSDSFIVSFAAPVAGFGTQIEPHYIRGPFTGDIDVYSPASVLLGTIPISGNATNAEDNSAPFFGIVSTTGADIGFASFLVDQAAPLLPAGAVAINRLDVLLGVPEPSSLAVLALGIAGIFGFRRIGGRSA